jgi:carbon-monoxide dehydrogenase medium subunit
LHKFEYHEPKTVEETCSLLQSYGNEAKLLAGGTDLLIKFRNGVIAPQQVVNIKKIPGMRDVSMAADGLHIGGAATMHDVEKLLAGFPEYQVLAEALHSVASCQIRNRATVAGNLCNASPAADVIPALAVLNASVIIAGLNGESQVLVTEFCTGPGKTVLTGGEWVTGILVPGISTQATGTYLKHSRRRMVDLATVGLAVLREGPDIRIALGAVGPTVIRARSAEEFLAEQGLDADTAPKAALLTAQAAAPIGDIRASREYRLHIVETLALRGLQFLQGGSAS